MDYFYIHVTTTFNKDKDIDLYVAIYSRSWKNLLKALQNQDKEEFRWNIYENRMTFTESRIFSVALRKQDKDDLEVFVWYNAFDDVA